MKSTDDRKLFGTPIGASAAAGNIATIPQTQGKAGDGTASVALGFPPETFIARAAGGDPPRGQDMNGLLNLLSSAIQVLQAGYLGPFDATFAQSIGGYPAGAIVSGSTPGTFWVSTADANVSTPGAGGASWQSLFNGYATQDWSNSQFVKNNARTKGGIVTLDLEWGTEDLAFQRADRSWGICQPKGDYATRDWAKGQFLQLAVSGSQTVTGPVAFGGKITVPDTPDFNSDSVLNARTADKRYVRNNAGTDGGVVALDMWVGTEDLSYQRADGSWGICQPKGDYALRSDLINPTIRELNGFPSYSYRIGSLLVQEFFTGDLPTNTGPQFVLFPTQYSSPPLVQTSMSFFSEKEYVNSMSFNSYLPDTSAVANNGFTVYSRQTGNSTRVTCGFFVRAIGEV